MSKREQNVIGSTEVNRMDKTKRKSIKHILDVESKAMELAASGEISQAIELQKKVYRMAKEMGCEDIKWRSMGEIAWYYARQEEYSKAIELQREIYKMAKETGSEKIKCRAVTEIARYYSEQGEYGNAIEVLKNAKEEMPNNGWILFTLATTYYEQARMECIEKAIEELEECLKIVKLGDDKQLLFHTYGWLMEVYGLIEAWDKVLEYAKEQIKLIGICDYNEISPYAKFLIVKEGKKCKTIDEVCKKYHIPKDAFERWQKLKETAAERILIPLREDLIEIWERIEKEKEEKRIE